MPAAQRPEAIRSALALGYCEFTPLGTATTGTLYILGRGGAQYAVRIFGETGKTRLLKFDRPAARWNPI